MASNAEKPTTWSALAQLLLFSLICGKGHDEARQDLA